MWDDTCQAVIEEFADLNGYKDIFKVTLRLTLAAFLGGILGYERERQSKEAGVRTHMLVAVGTALFVAAPLIKGVSVNDMSRVLQGIIQGIGFLGVGTIIVGTATTKTRGLTTAGSIWATAGVGMAAGLGMGVTAALSTLIILFILAVLPYLLRYKKVKDG